MNGIRFSMITLGLLIGLVISGCADGGRPAGRPAAEQEQVTPTAGPSETPTGLPASEPEATPAATGEVNDPPVLTDLPEATPEPVSDTTSPLQAFQSAQGRPRIVAIDPGHGGAEVGAAGAGVAEKNVNLGIALKLRDLLIQDGLQVVLTRDDDRRVCPAPGEETPEGYSVTRADLQCRVDIANEAKADVFLSIHNNGSGDPGQSGTEVWYDGKRHFALYNQALAEQVLGSLVEAIRDGGYRTRDRGIKEDSSFRTFQGRQYPIFELGPPRTGRYTTRASQMPAILGETLFLSNPAEAQLLTDDSIREAIARGYRNGLLEYFQLIDDGTLTMPEEGWPEEEPVDYPAPVRAGA